ncbi:MAG: YegS/Rv2252/BmrU family lipid kinase [Oscillospiraceae bacterium]|nr:YegS/Rv2252/BmrU family lipid kinase [Oscillospiraceae bacterium]
MQKLLLIVNPNAGRMKAGSALMDMVSGFAAADYEVTVFPTTRKGDAQAKVASLTDCGYDLIVCYGGDGTLSEVINGIAQLPAPSPAFSFITAGTSNDFARTVSMPAIISKAVDKIVNGQNVPLDLGEIVEDGVVKHFFYVAAFGLFSSVSYVVPQSAKKAFGHLAYVAEGAKQAIDIPAYKMKVEYDGKSITDEFVVGLVANTTSVAGMFKVDPAKVILDDGLFELILVKKPSNPILLSKIIMDLSAKKYHPEYVIFEQVKECKFTCKNEDVAWCLDGENGGVHRSVEIKNLYRRGLIRL